MADESVRCTHCGLSHTVGVLTCPTTGLKINADEQLRRAKRKHDAGEVDRVLDGLQGKIVAGEFFLKRQLGQGGMGAVFESTHLPSNSAVALKLLQPSLVDDPEANARMRNEAEVVRDIDHPNICKVHDIRSDEDVGQFLVMELLHGQTLAEKLVDNGPMHFWELAPILVQVLAALDAAHARGYLHRDMKPENIFVSTSNANGTNEVKLLDFGVSKSVDSDKYGKQRLTHTGMVMGTPYYMAPEQARGDSRIDRRVDLWAVGVIMYEMLTGVRPFVASNYNALLVKILTVNPKRISKVAPNISLGVEAVVGRSIAKLRDDRFQYASQMAHALLDVLRSEKRPDGLIVAAEVSASAKRAPAETRAERIVAISNLVEEDPETMIEGEEDHDGYFNTSSDDIERTHVAGLGSNVVLDEEVPETHELTIKERLYPKRDDVSLPVGTGRTGGNTFAESDRGGAKVDESISQSPEDEEQEEPTLAIRRYPRKGDGGG